MYDSCMCVWFYLWAAPAAVTVSRQPRNRGEEIFYEKLNISPGGNAKRSVMSAWSILWVSSIYCMCKLKTLNWNHLSSICWQIHQTDNEAFHQAGGLSHYVFSGRHGDLCCGCFHCQPLSHIKHFILTYCEYIISEHLHFIHFTMFGKIILLGPVTEDLTVKIKYSFITLLVL